MYIRVLSVIMPTISILAATNRLRYIRYYKMIYIPVLSVVMPTIDVLAATNRLRYIRYYKIL